jgi:hypothetical protein
MLSRFNSIFSSPKDTPSDIATDITLESDSQTWRSSFKSNQKVIRLKHMLSAPQIDIGSLKKAVCSGCPEGEYSMREICWKLLLGYLPSRTERHNEVLDRKRKEYSSLIKERTPYITGKSNSADDSITGLVRQISLDVPRTYLGTTATILSSPRVRCIIERVLFIWAQRNPACGYVQGMNDLTTPIMVVLLQGASLREIEAVTVEDLSDEQLDSIEADLYWMLSKLLQDLQDHYTFSQPGIQSMVKRLDEILTRKDPLLKEHLELEQVPLLQVTFRWYNCLLARELNLQCLIRLFDTLLAEDDGFTVFIVYFSAALLSRMSTDLRKLDFQAIMMLMTAPTPPCPLTALDMETLIAETYVLNSLFPPE